MWKVHGKMTIRVHLGGKLVDEKVFDSKKITIGRDPACDLVIDNKLVSGRHCRISRAEAGYILEDLGSTNGTLLGGQPIQREVLRVGSVATLGKHTLEFIEAGESLAPDAGHTTIAPRTDATITANPAQARELYARASLQAFVDAGGKLGELRLKAGRAAPSKLRLEKELTRVGKEVESDLRLSGFMLPATAFYVERAGKGYRLASPTRKVKVNGKTATGTTGLRHGDEITVGPVTLQFVNVG